MDISPERWQKIEQLYHAALEREPGGRSAFLDQACQGDVELRREVEALLAQGDAGGDSTVTMLTPGAQLGPYQIEAQIGAGGMGSVYRAVDTRLGRKVAIKICAHQFSGRFEREARAISSLNHPHICTLYDVGPNYLVMELVEGETLAARLQKGRLPMAAVLRYAAEIADALAAAHALGIIHRDLKPQNIMITKSGVKVLDFGLAKSPRDETLTATRVVMGTPAYMAPEQLEGKECDARSDIYALGLVLYETAAGRRLPRGQPPLMEGLPLQFAHVIERCVESEPDNRWQSASDVKGELEWAGKTQELAPLHPTGLRHKLPWAVAGVLAVVAIALGTALWRFTRPVEAIPQPVVRLDLDLGPDVSLGSTTGPAVILSPDGTRLVFVSQGPDRVPRLFTRSLDQPKATRLAKTEGAYAPFFSPDGQWVGFFAQGKLKKTRIDGGDPVSLCDAPNGRGASWGEDGTIVAALDSLGVLSQVPAEGGKPVPLMELGPGENTHRWPYVLPGGKGVLFNARMAYGNYDEAEIAVVSLKDHRRKTLLPHGGMYPRYLPNGFLTYVTKGSFSAVPFDLERLEVRGAAILLNEVSTNPSLGFAQFDFAANGTSVYRTGGTEGLRTIQWLDEAGKTTSLGIEPGVYLFPRLSPDGSRLAYGVSQGANTDVWIYDLQRGSKTRLTGGGNNTFPVWSPDGRYVVFQSAGGMFLVRADGASKPQPLAQSRTIQLPTSFSPDGSRLVYSELTPGGAEIRTVPVASRSGQLSAGQPQLFVKASSANTFAAFSPDGRWLAYADAEADSNEVYVRAFPDNGTQVQISNAGGIVPVWSRKGHQIFYQAEDRRIMVVDYTLREGAVVVSKPRVWFGKQLVNLGTAIEMDFAPDGKRAIVLMPAESPEPRETQSHVTLVVNFFEEVRRRVAAGK